MEKSNEQIQQELYDRLTAITREWNEGVEVKEHGYTGILVRPLGINVSSVSVEEIVREFNGHYLDQDGLVLYNDTIWIKMG